MNRPSMRQRALLLPAAALLLIVSCLGDPTGPARSGLLSLAPKYANTMASAIVDVSAVRVELRRPGTTINVVDTVLVFRVDSDTIDLTVDVPLERASEDFELRLAMTNAAGDTVFRAGPIIVTATSGGRPSDPAEPEFTYVGVGANAAGVRFVSPPTGVPFGGTVTLTAEAFDGQGTAIANTPIGFELVTLADTTRARVNARTGVLTGGLKRGDVAVRAVLASGQTATHTVTVKPVAIALTRVSGHNQVGLVGQPLAAPLVARVLAADNLGVEGAIVEWEVVVGTQTIATQRDTSDAAGLIDYALTLTQSAEEHEVYARIVGNDDALVFFSATAGAGVASRLSFITEPVNTGAAQVITPAVRVAILDAQGNVNIDATDLVTLSLLDSDLEPADLQGTASVAAVAGIATFADLRVNLARSEYVLRAASGVLTPDTSAMFNINAGAAIALAFSEEPPAAVAVGTVFFVEVVAHDAGGNRIQIPGTVAIALNANPGSATLGGTLTATMVEHVVQFGDLTLDAIASGYTLSASTPGLATAVSGAFAVTVPASVNAWINPAGGNWSEAVNWSRGVVPTAIDTVSIALSGNYTVVVDVPTTVGRVEVGGATGSQQLDVNSTLTLTDTLVVDATARLNLLGGAIDGAGDARIAGHFGWSGGSLSGSGVLRVLGSMAITGAATRNFTERTLELRGTGTWADAQTINAGLGSVLRVFGGATLDLQGSPQWIQNQGGTSAFEILGTVTKTGAGYVLVPGLSVSGALTVADGTMEARQAGTSSGTVQVGATAVLMLGTGTHTFSAGSTVQGEGFVQVTGASTVNANGVWDVDGFTQVTSGVLNFNGTGNTSSLYMDGGTRAGSGLLTVSDMLAWTSGGFQAGGGTTRVLPGASLAATGIGTKTLSAQTLEVAGTAVWSGTHTMNSGNGAVWRVLPAATFDAQGTPSLVSSLGGVQTLFENQGTMSRTANVGAVTMGARFVSTGTLGVATGSLTLAGGGTLGGTASVATGATLDFSAGAFVMADDFAVTGAGDVRLVGASLTTAAPLDTVRFTRLRLVSGTFAPVGVARISGLLSWEGAAGVTGGTTRVDLGGQLQLTNATARNFTNATLENAGTATWSGGFSFNTGLGARLVNLAGGTFDWSGNGSFVSNQGAPLSEFVNEGVFSYTGAGIGTMTGFLVDTVGTQFRVESGELRLGNGARLGGAPHAGGTVTLTNGTLSQRTGTAWTIGAGHVGVTGGVITVDSGGTVTLPELELAGGAVQHEGEFVIANELRWSSGAILSNVVGLGGTTRLAPGANMTISGATVKTFTGVHRLVNPSGIVTFGGTGDISAGNGVRIENGGTFDFEGAGQLLLNQGGAATFLNQAGALVSVTGTEPGVMGFTLDNAGGVLNPVSDTLRLTGGSINNFAGNAIIGAGTALTLGGGTFMPTAPFNFGGNLVVSAGTFDAGATTSTINGDLIVRSGGLVNMTAPTGLIAIDGDAEFGGSAGAMTAGRMDIAGDFRQLGGATNFAASGAHVTRFDGATAQSITFTAPGIPNNRFQTVQVVNTSATDSVMLGSNAVAMGNLDVQTGRLGKVVPWRFNVLGDASMATGGGQGLRPFVLEVTGVFTNPGSMQPDTLVLNNPGIYTWSVNPAVGVNFRVNAGTVTYMGTNAPEDVIVSGTGVLDIPGANRAFFGDLVTQGNGRLQMTTLGASLLVSGNAVFGGGNTSGLLTEGNLQVSGNFSQLGTTSALSYAPSGNHRTTIAGGLGSSISFATPTSSHFDSLVVAKNMSPRSTVTLLTDARVTGGMTARDGSDIVGPTARLTVNGVLTTVLSTASPTIQTLRALELNATPVITALVAPDTVVYNNGVTSLPVHAALQYRSVRLSTGAPIVMVSDTIAGDLDITTGVAAFAVGSVTFRVNGKLRTRGVGQLQMSNFDANLTVVDSAIFGGASTNGILTNGSLTLLGNFVQQGNAAAFAATTGHSTRFAGTALQTISFANPDSTNTTSHFANFNLMNSSTAGVRLQSPVHAVGQLVQVMAAEFGRLSSVTGTPFVTRGINADSLTMDGVPLRIANGAAFTNMSVVQFLNMPANTNHFELQRAGGTYSPNALEFPGAPSAGFYNVVVRNTAGLAMVANFFNSPQSWAVMTGPPRRYLLTQTGGVMPTSQWNGQALTP